MNRWLRNTAVTVSTLVSLAALAGCGGAGNTGASAAAPAGQSGAASGVAADPQPGPNEVFMIHTKFVPNKVEIAAGTTLKWTNLDPTEHSVVEGEPGNPASPHLFSTNDLPKGGTFSYKFDKPGTYTVFCDTAFHYTMGMTMTVVVK